MKRLRILPLAGAILSLAGIAHAEAPADPPGIFHVNLTGEEVNLIGRALGKLPLEDSLTTWTDLQRQVLDEQNAAKKAAAEAKMKATEAPSKPAAK